MKYRYFASKMDAVEEQFAENYGSENILCARTQDEFEEILALTCHDILDREYKAVLLETFLFFDLFHDKNLSYLKNLENHFHYIVFVGPNLEELFKRVQDINIKKKKVKKEYYYV